jgi:hypothetical protein
MSVSCFLGSAIGYREWLKWPLPVTRQFQKANLNTGRSDL